MPTQPDGRASRLYLSPREGAFAEVLCKVPIRRSEPGLYSAGPIPVQSEGHATCTGRGDSDREMSLVPN